MTITGDVELVRSALERVRDYSNLAAAREIGVSEGTVRRWRDGRIAVPLRTSTRLTLRQFLDESDLGVVITSRGPSVLVDDDSPAPDYDSLGIDLPGYERLHDRPRLEFDRFMLELIAAGLGREDIEELGRGLLAPVAHLNTLHKGKEESDARSEEDQMLIMNGMIPVIRKIVRERGRN